MYHDKQAAIIVEHDSLHQSQQAVHTLNLSHPDLTIKVIDDLRQIINNQGPMSIHTP